MSNTSSTSSPIDLSKRLSVLMHSNSRKAKSNVTSDDAREVQALAWKEIIRELSAKVPGLEGHWLESL